MRWIRCICTEYQKKRTPLYAVASLDTSRNQNQQVLCKLRCLLTYSASSPRKSHLLTDDCSEASGSA